MNGKEKGKNAFLSFPVLPFLALFFPVFGQNHEKGLNSEKTARKI